MEHLLPTDRDAPIVVPCWCKESIIHPIQDFDSFPEQAGWDFSTWRQHDAVRKGIDLPGWLKKNNRSIHEFITFWQTWLWFKLLASALQTSISSTDFVRVDCNGMTVLTTATLERYLATFESEIAPKLSANAKRAAFENFIVAMRAARVYVYNLFQTLRYETPPEIQALQEVHFETAVLIRALDSFVGPLLGGRSVVFGIIGGIPLLEERMRQEGWCPHSLSRLSGSVMHDSYAYTYALGTVRSQQSHAKCTESFCVSNQAGEDFEPLHANSGCACTEAGPKIDEIIQVLRASSIPVLKVHYSGIEDTSPSFEVRAADNNTPYLALSHVWADGLGNPKANTIPMCQLRLITGALRGKVDEKGQDLYFWLDTLCIPVDKTLQDLRNFSIGRMHSIYKDSYGVLVLDPDFSLIKEKSPCWEILTRLFISGWSTRLWTYQESALPRRLFIRVVDGMINIDELMDWIQMGKVNLSPVTGTLTASAFGACRIFVPRQHSMDTDASDYWMQTTIFAMRNRITSRPGDEAVCVATSLGLDATPVLQCRPEQRMHQLLELFPAIPLNILFAAGPRLQEKGFRWAPQSFLGPRGGVGSPIPTETRLKDGTLYKRPMAYLHPEGKGVIACLSGIKIAKLDLRQTRWEIQLPSNIRIYASNFFNESVSTFSMKDLSILLPEPLDLSDSDRRYSSMTGLLVAPDGRVRDPADSRFSFKMLRFAWIIGTVDVEFEVDGRTVRGMAKGEAIPPRWWLLDGA